MFTLPLTTRLTQTAKTRLSSLRLRGDPAFNRWMITVAGTESPSLRAGPMPRWLDSAKSHYATSGKSTTIQSKTRNMRNKCSKVSDANDIKTFAATILRMRRWIYKGVSKQPFCCLALLVDTRTEIPQLTNTSLERCES